MKFQCRLFIFLVYSLYMQKTQRMTLLDPTRTISLSEAHLRCMNFLKLIVRHPQPTSTHQVITLVSESWLCILGTRILPPF
jgi:hypothetical protein